MTFSDAMLIEEMHEAAESKGLTDQVAYFVEQILEHNSTQFRKWTMAGGVAHALDCELAILRGQGFIGANNEYPGPAGRVDQAG